MGRVRIAIAGITNEALASSPVKTRMEDFRVLRGEAILHEARVYDLARTLDIEPVPILTATHIAPGGSVEQQAYLQLRDEIITRLQHAADIDGVLLLLHGAMLVEHIWSGDTDLVRSIRAALGREVLISARLDLHANLEDDFANRTDIWTGFRTAPHRDAVETTQRALRLLVEAVRSGKRPRPVFIRVPLLLQGEKATTAVEPMRSFEEMARAAEQLPGIVDASVFVGFGWADSPQASSSVVVVAEDEAHLPLAREQARRIAQSMWDRRREFTFDQEVAASVDEALDLALAAPEPSVWLTDSGDNPTAGTPGDSTFFLRRMLERDVPDAVVGSIPDFVAWQACCAAGAGGEVALELGGHWDNTQSGPLAVNARVEFADDDIATIAVGGVRVLVTRRRVAMTSLDQFRRAGIDPLRHKIVVVKLGYLMPELRDAAPREILVMTPGYSDMQLERLPYRYLTRPIFPLDREFEWRPRISNVAGYVD